MQDTRDNYPDEPKPGTIAVVDTTRPIKVRIYTDGTWAEVNPASGQDAEDPNKPTWTRAKFVEMVEDTLKSSDNRPMTSDRDLARAIAARFMGPDDGFWTGVKLTSKGGQL
jgi:hypothetical protein